MEKSGGAMFYSPDSPVNRRVEIAGIPAKLVSSNIRRLDVPWHQYGLSYGRGYEGNVVMVEALTSRGARVQVENQSGRDERIYEGDKLIGVLASRHSGTSESGDVPSEGLEIHPDTELSLLASGGILGINATVPPTMRGEPMKFRALGLVTAQERPVDLIGFAGGHDSVLKPSAPIVMVCGTSAEVGKTTTASGLIRAFKIEGIQAAGVKFSGTGRMRDILSLRDAGAHPWIDFPDVGLATTYTSPERFIGGIYTLFNRVNSYSPDIIIAEAGGDPIEANVPTFLSDPKLMDSVRAAVIVAGDVMGMMGAISYLRPYLGEKPIFVTDPKGRNPATTRDRIAHELPGVPVFNSLDTSQTLEVARQLL